MKRVLHFITGLLVFTLLSMPSSNADADPLSTIINQSNIHRYPGTLIDGRTYTLENDIDLSSLTLGDADSYLGDLAAVFDGNLKQITGLSKPLFNLINTEAEVKDLTLSTAAEGGITAVSLNTGVLAKTSLGEITSVTVSGNIDADLNDNIGGIVGEIYGGSITDSHSQVAIVNGGTNVGGLIGSIYLDGGGSVSILDSSASSTVEGVSDVGGLIGDVSLDLDSTFTITDSHSHGDVNSEGDDIGGLIGYMSLTGAQATITGSSATGSVHGDDDVGGLIGDIQMDAYSNEDTVVNSQLTIEDSFSSGGLISGDDSVGGLIGEVTVESLSGYLESVAMGSLQISNSYSTNNVEATGSGIGGLIGSITEPWYSPPYGGVTVSISESNATGNVEGFSSVGGLLGYGWYVQISDSYATGTVGIASEFIDCDPEFVSCPEYFGGLVGYVYNTIIERSYAQGDVTGGDHVGGLIGEASNGFVFTNIINESHATGQIVGINNVGGLIGTIEEYSLVENVFASGDVSATGYSVGGLIGEVARYTVIELSIAYGDVEGDHNVGGLVGDLWGSISDSIALGNVDGLHRVGGLVGIQQESSAVTDSGAFGDVNLNSICKFGPYAEDDVYDRCDFIGGLVGWMAENSSVSSSSATGEVRGRFSVGGLVGETYGGIQNSWAEGVVTANGEPGEEFVGFCATRPDFCEMDVLADGAEIATNFDPDPSSPTLRPDKDGQLEMLNLGLESGFAFNDCIYGGAFPHLISLADSYTNPCDDEEGPGGRDPVAIAVSIPDPEQTDYITSISPNTGTSGTEVKITGSFKRTVTRISLGAVTLEQGEFTQTETTLTFRMPVLKPGPISIQIFNGAVPLLAPVIFNYMPTWLTQLPRSQRW